MICLSCAISLIPHCTEGYEPPKEINPPVSLRFFPFRRDICEREKNAGHLPVAPYSTFTAKGFEDS